MTTLLDIWQAVDSAPIDPDYTARCDVDPLVCPWCGGDGKPRPSDTHVARALGDPDPTTCKHCRGSGRRNCERCRVRPCDRYHLSFGLDLCALCDSDGREKDPCAVCGKRNIGILHYPCGQVFCSERCTRRVGHKCNPQRKRNITARRSR